MVSISIPVVLEECITLCTLEGNVWKCGKAISDGLHVSSLKAWKYLAIISDSASNILNLEEGMCMGRSFTFLPRGMNSSIDNSTKSTCGLQI